jgi:4-amino-4-deoxy-L-arabinose transferase-like glycosyltransferase
MGLPGSTEDVRTKSVNVVGAVVRPVLIAACVLAVVRVVYLAFLCPYTLIEDEAQYWVWSKFLSWSYYTKGPGVAWTIFASTSIFGDAEWAVRLPAVIASGMTSVVIAVLAWDTLRDRAVAVRAAWCFILAPTFLALAMLMTIDGPYVLCWAIAAWAAWRAAGLGRARWWVLCGLAIGAGVLYKYTMLLILPGIAWWVWRHRREGVVHAGWMLAGLGVMLLAFLPVILWNQQYGWPTVKHLLGHLGVAGGDMPVTQGKGGWKYTPEWTLVLIGSQLGLIGPVLVLGIMGAARALRERGSALGGSAVWRGASFLVAVALPMYVFYLLVSFFAEPEGNWPIAGAVTLMPLAGYQVVRGLCAARGARGWGIRQPWTATGALWALAIIIGVGAGVGALRLDWIAKIPGLERVVPVGRLTGAKQMGVDAARMMAEVGVKTGKQPFLVTTHYGRASQLMYYYPISPRGTQKVFCASSLMPGGRVTPWDFWPELDLRRHDELLGRPAVAVGLSQYHWLQVFDRVGEPVRLAGDHKEFRSGPKAGQPSRPAFEAQGFRGFPKGGVQDPPAEGGGS